MAKCDKKHAPSWLHAKKHMKKFRSKIKTTSMSGPHPRIFNNGNNHNKTWEVSRSKMAQTSYFSKRHENFHAKSCSKKFLKYANYHPCFMDDCENILIGERFQSFKKKKSYYYDPACNRKALWLPWPPAGPVSKPLQILWMVVPDPVDSSPSTGSQPPLIANPPSQPLIIPSHVAHALLLTR